MKNLIVSLLAASVFSAFSAFANETPLCRVVPSGGLPVVFAGERRIERTWTLAQARVVVDNLVAAGICMIDTSQLPECRIYGNGSFWAVYSEGFWRNFHESDLAGAQALVAELQANQFCYEF